MKYIYTFLFACIILVNSLSAQTNAVNNISIGTDNDEPAGIVKGKIMTTDGKPAAFVNVSLKEINKATISTEDGLFILHHIKPGTYILVVSHTGLVTQEKSITVSADQTLEVVFTLKEDSKQLDAVIVEGRKSPNERPLSIGKMPMAPIDLPQSVTVVGQGIIRDQQAQRLSDVIKNVNGVYLGTTRGATQEAFYARGYSFSSTNMFKNGARVNSGTFPEMSGLERVEILKGSAAILYGNVAPGGILNMVTKQPKFNFGGEVSMRFGSYDLYKPAFDIYGPISSKLAYRLNGTYEKANSYRDQVHSTRYYVNPSFLYRLGKNTELVLEGDYLYHKFTPDFGIGTLADTVIPKVARGAFFGTPWQYAKTQQSSATATVRHRFSDSWNLNGSVSYSQYDRDYYSIERIQAKLNGDWNRPLNKLKNQEKYYVAQVFLNGHVKTGVLEHNILTGVDADRSVTTNTNFNNPTAYDVINILDPTKYKPRTDMPVADNKTSVAETPVNRFGAYVQDLISLGEHWKLLAGIRWSIQEAPPATTTTYKSPANDVVKSARKTDRAFSPRVGLVYKPLPNMSVFASYANSFTTNTGTDINGVALDPSIIDQYELGIKNDFLQGALSVNVTGYRIINNNLAQIAPFTADGRENNNSNIKQLTGQTTSDGIEVDIAAHPVSGLNIIAGYSYNYMRYTKTDMSKKGNFIEGERLVNTPMHTANASAFYTFNAGRLKGLKFGVNGVYIGDRVGGWNNTIGQTQVNRKFPVAGFTTVDLSAGYTIRNISLLAKISNLTNEYNYYVHENYSINPIAPRQFMATIAYKF